MKTRRQIFTVEGRLAFPLDMLRYDCCWPRDNASPIHTSIVEPRADNYVVELVTDNPHAPTNDRWASFGWTVTSVRSV